MKGVLEPGRRKAYALAGCATLTIRSTKTDARFTYKVQLSDDGKRHFVKLLRGQDNTSDYTYLGQVRDGRFSLTQASKAGANAPSVVAFNWLVGHWEDPQVEVWHEGSCGRCGRKLTVPESIESGIGPTCAGRE